MGLRIEVSTNMGGFLRKIFPFKKSSPKDDDGYEPLCHGSELVVVNGEPLSQDELHVLKTCPNPPKKLKPGFYWYDSVSGFWGKEGHGPCQIISSQLKVGGYIRRDASNGNTKILINNREITKRELWMLLLAGINCDGQPSFWLSADGKYQVEGQRNEYGPIWDKMGIKLVCALLSLPVPPDTLSPSEDDVSQRTLEQQVLQLLSNTSDTSTIHRQQCATELCSKILTATDVGVRLSFPTTTLREHLRLEEDDESLDFQVKDSNMKVWTFRLDTRKNDCHSLPVVTKGWLDFVKCKELRVGDKVIFLVHELRNDGVQLEIRVQRNIKLFDREHWAYF